MKSTMDLENRYYELEEAISYAESSIENLKGVPNCGDLVQTMESVLADMQTMLAVLGDKLDAAEAAERAFANREYERAVL